jgi:hypothetical protein
MNVQVKGDKAQSEQRRDYSEVGDRKARTSLVIPSRDSQNPQQEPDRTFESLDRAVGVEIRALKERASWRSQAVKFMVNTTF